MTEVKRALIATHHLVSFAGSEIATLELATTLMSMGWEVTVAAMLIGEPMVVEFQSRSITILNLLEPQLPIDGQHFELVWIHHLPVFHEIVLCRKITGKRLIFYSLSPFEPLEAVPVLYDSINLLLANSRENADHILQRLGLPWNAVKVFPNSVPQHFWKTPKASHSQQPGELALISNHPPEEIIELIVRLKESGKEIRHIGLKGEPTLVTPDELLGCDAVISIGKTVQYCFALKIPVYCYDHFGGPGWLDDCNFDLACCNNFSGRGFQKKDTATIMHEIEAGYTGALASLDKHYEFANSYCHLEKNLNQILSCEPSHLPPFAGAPSQECLSQHACYKRLTNDHQNNTVKINSLHVEILQLNTEVRRLKATYSWQITKPLRLLANLPHLIKIAFYRK